MSAPSYPLADLTLSRRLERAEGQTSAAFAVTKARLQPASGAAYRQIAGVDAIFDGHDSPLTQTFGLGMIQPATEAVLTELEQFFLSRRASVQHEVSPLAGCDLIASLADRGYRPVECSSVLFRPLNAKLVLTGHWTSSFQVRPAPPDEHSLWAATAAEGWREFGDFSSLMNDVVNTFGQCGCWTPFIVFQEAAAVATAALSIVEDVALLAGASTIPAARRQGAQLLLLDARLRYAAARGCTLAMFCASPGSASQRNAERQGFRIAYTRTKWSLRATETTPLAGRQK